MVGDILDDVEAGRRAGCRTVLLDNGHETVWRRSALRSPDLLAADLDEAARLILCAQRRRRPYFTTSRSKPVTIRLIEEIKNGA